MPHEHLNLEVVHIVRDWNNLAERTKYERRLHELGPTAVETLLVLVRLEIAKNKRRRQLSFVLYALAIACMLPALFVDRTQLWAKVMSHLFRWMFMIPAFCCFFWQPHRAARILADFDDLRALGPLIEAWEDENARPILSDALTRLLPQIRASDAGLLSARQRKALYEILRSTKDKATQLAILQSLEQIGDGAAVPYVEKLANPPEGAKVSEEVQEAAKACLPFLTQRAEQERLSMTLLRAAGTMETQPGELLRPAANNVETDSHALLRATQQD